MGEIHFHISKAMPFFSIIIPVYNVAPYLCECLDSVLAQTFTDWEAICVDDGSADGSGLILDEYAAKDKRFRVIHQSNAGVSAARNAALDVMKGKWFLFLDGDDVLRTDGLDVFVQYTREYNYDGILVHPYIPYWQGHDIPQRIIKTMVLLKDATKEDLIFGPYAANGFPFSRIYKREFFGNLRFPIGVRMCEDICFWFDALCVPARWLILNSEYYLYRQHADSVCGQKDPNDCEATLNAALYACDKIEKEIGYGKGGGRRYFERWPWSSLEYLNIFVSHYREVSEETKVAVFSKVNKIKMKTGIWPYTRRMKWNLWLIENKMGYLINILNLVDGIRSSTGRIMSFSHHIRKNGVAFTFRKLKRRILRQGEYARNVGFSK